MSLLWIEAASVGKTGVEHLPTQSLIDPMYLRAWGHPDHPPMAALMNRLHGDGGYDPEHHGLLHTTIQEDGRLGFTRLPPEHQIEGFGDNSGSALAIALHHLGHEHVPVMVTRKGSPAASADPIHAPVLYHGTAADRALTEITPLSDRHPHLRVPERSEYKGGNGTYSDPGFAYATADPDDAWHWAQEAWHKNPRGIPRVFRVRGRGPMEPDPNFSHHDNPQQVRSRHGFDVVGEEPMPHDIRHLYEDED